MMYRSKTRFWAWLLSGVSLALGALHFVHLRTLWGLSLWVPKMLAGALSPWLAVLGAVGALLGAAGRAPLAIAAGIGGAWASARYVWRTVTALGDFERAFGLRWAERISEAQRQGMLKERWTWFPGRAAEARLARDVLFARVPGTERPLLCDVWQPPPGVAPSGLAFVYLHGSGWYLSDKDVGTRPFFRHLASQGHVIVDVAYRLCPEADMWGMVGDVKRAVAWIKANAADYGVDPGCVVLAGGSAGAHLALLAAYTPDHPELTPDELAGVDVTVRAVVAFYGPTDLRAIIDYNEDLIRWQGENSRPAVHIAPQGRFGWGAQQLDRTLSSRCTPKDLVGGVPEEVPEMYDLGSPLHHAGPGCPPTFLVHGTHDLLVPVASVRALHRKLLAADVPVVYLELPETDHAFDLVLPRFSPPAQVAWYEVERFLALVDQA
ncbi:MAG: alpha/beta hydrolase [Anaerolineae bacterium]|jgi:acetyl esterase/lipase